MPSKTQRSTTPLRLPPDLKRWARERAKSQGLSLNAMIIEMLQRQRASEEAPSA